MSVIQFDGQVTNVTEYRIRNLQRILRIKEEEIKKLKEMVEKLESNEKLAEENKILKMELNALKNELKKKGKGD